MGILCCFCLEKFIIVYGVVYLFCYFLEEGIINYIYIFVGEGSEKYGNLLVCLSLWIGW